jgi:putative phosphoribosyl transferase
VFRDHMFRDRHEAGRVLALKLRHLANRADVVIYALPRGGVPVAHEVARALAAPLDVFIVRKLGAPGHEELAIGAIASGGIRVLNHAVIHALGISVDTIERVSEREVAEIERREAAYRGHRPKLDPKGKIAVLIDDGLATGATMRAAVEALRTQGPQRIVVAVPIASPETCEMFKAIVDETICARTPDPFYGVGEWYEDFSQTSDEEVTELLAEAVG